MALFLDQLPFHHWTDQTRTPPVRHWSVRLSVIPADAALHSAPAMAQPQPWVLDTGFVGEAFAWRYHLVSAGMDPDVERTGNVRAVSSLGAGAVFPVRNADLWLVSNLPASAGTPWRIELDRGIVFRDVPNRPDPNLQRPLLGMRALIRAGFRIELDFARQAVSLWTP